MIYKEYSKLFPVVKVQEKSETVFNYNLAWKRINSPVLSSDVRDTSCLIVHNKLPVIERLFRVGMTNDPYCILCPGAVICDVEHYFCSCERVSKLWCQISSILFDMVGTDLPDWEWIDFLMPKSEYEQEAVWLISNYLTKLWAETYIHNVVELKEEEFFGYLSFKFKEDKRGARYKMKTIPGLQ